MTPQAAPLELILITGMSGSGKSVALHALEDAGYFCVDNLPPELLLSFVALEQQHGARRVAIAMDVRSATSLPLVPAQLRELRQQGLNVRPLFLDATTETLVRRFSETRRRHPLSQRTEAGAAGVTTDQHRALVESIELERELLADLREQQRNEENVQDDRDDRTGLLPFLPNRDADRRSVWRPLPLILAVWSERRGRHHGRS